MLGGVRRQIAESEESPERDARVEVCDNGGFAGRDRDVLVAGAFDNCEGDCTGHWVR